MNAIQQQLTNAANGISFTGNATVDSIILLNLVPMIIAYIYSVWGVFRDFGKSILLILINYVKNKIKNRFAGDIILDISIQEDSQIYKHIVPIFDKKYNCEDDGVKSSFLNATELFNIDDGVNLENHMYQYYFDGNSKFNMDLEYNDDNMFSIHKKYDSFSTKTKVFTYKNMIIKFSLRRTAITFRNNGNNNDTDDNKLPPSYIDIKVLNFDKNRKYEQNEAVKELEKFMCDELKIKEHIHFTYTISIIGREVYEHFVKLTNYARSSGHAKEFGNNKLQGFFNTYDSNDKEKSFYIDRNIMIDVKNNNFTKSRNYYDDIDITHSSTENMTNLKKHRLDYRSIYCQYISNKLEESDRSYTFIINDNKIYFFIFDAITHTVKIHLISFGKKLCEGDIKENINYLLKQPHRIPDKKSKSTSPILQDVNIVKFEEAKWKKYRMDRRCFDTIYLPADKMNAIRREIEDFVEMEKMYSIYQIPYKKGMLFYGPPGTGKTSLVKALAYEYQMDIYLMNVNDEQINDETIVNILNSLASSGNKILLFEDIDTAFADKEKMKDEIRTTEESVPKISSDKGNKVEMENKKNKKFLTYSGLLNALDGVLSNQNGVITIMTTNYKDKLGDALIRPGRIDATFELNECNKEQICRMVASFIKKRQQVSLYGNEIAEIDWCEMDKRIEKFAEGVCDENGNSKIKPCSLQFYILKNLRDINNIFENYTELLE